MEEKTEMATEKGETVRVAQPRAYQLELFEASMKRNVIVTMDTGSGKTQVAKLRIEAELERCSPEKLVWFLVPTVVLAEQQHKYLTDQLPAYQSRLICGSDNVEHWSTSAIWDAVLRDIRIVVSTSRILLDALVHGFVRMSRIALLVFDEAHHCMRSHDTNRIMQEFYHVASAPGDVEARPYILGLSASPITNAKPLALEKLEQNLNSICKAPTRHLEELQRFVHQPQMCKLAYADDLVPPSQALQKLEQLVIDFDVFKDPFVRYLQRDGSPQGQKRLQKTITTRSTESLKQLKALLRRTIELHQQIGEWASTYFLHACVQNVREKVERCSTMVVSLQTQEEVFLFELLSTVVGERGGVTCHEVEADISPKATLLLKYLEAEYTEHVTGIIFVKERSTAAILAHLISHHPNTQKYTAEPFVGSSNFARKQNLADLADLKTQNAALTDFRLGKNNLLVCTSVMEEGVDISSMNLVIRFDEPANFRAFIQSRGRARMVESKFVLMCGENEAAGSYHKWKALEAEMKAKYMDEMRQIAQCVEDEDQETEEAYDEYIANDITGARLSIHDTKGHLEHFCARLPTVPYADPPRPEYILEALPAGQFQADVVLPHSVNIVPRRIHGRFAWMTRKMAIKDVALRAYARLYDAGLINKNLLPTALPDPVVPMSDAETEEEESLVCVRSRMNPWSQFPDSRGNAYRQVLTLRAQFSEEEELPRLYLVLPEGFDMSMTFKMFWSIEQSIDVEISPERLVDNVLHDQDFQDLGLLSTQRLFESIFLGKMNMQSEVPQVLPFLVVPFLECRSLHDWLDQCTGDTLADNVDELQPEQGLIRLKSWSRAAPPYIFRSSVVRARESQWIDDSISVPQPANDELHFEVKKLPKRLDYLHPANFKDFNTAIEFVPAAECYIDRFPTIYAKFMLLLPSILHKLELRAVAVALSRNILPSIGFRHLELVENAICSSAANESTNYQRLELIGDTVLKFWTSTQLCAQFPGWHEGYLSRGKDRVVSNAHLCKVAKDHGLDEYIHTAPFAGSRWTPPMVELRTRDEVVTRRRKISRKVLADVVEALIGASFLDGKDEQERAFKVKACLTTFLDSVSWRSPIENAAMLKNLVPRESPAFDNFSPLTEITGFSFEKRILLIEALTHPSHPPVGIQGSYQRLEFLGDSILDFIVVETMARHTRELPHFTMHLIRAAVVNAHLLAFFCLGSGVEHDRAEVRADASSGAVEISTAKGKTYLWEFMKHSGKLELLEAQKACAKRYDQLALAIDAALDHGRSHPWYHLLSLKAEKFFSDIVESILGAIFIDSNGNLQACKEFLERLGLLRYLRRIIAENIDVMHPKERLGIVAGNSKVRYGTASKIVDAAAQYSCTVSVDDESAATSIGEVSRAAAEAKAAQDAVAVILKERRQDVGEGEDEMNV